MRNLTLKQIGVVLISIIIISLILILYFLFEMKKTSTVSLHRLELINIINSDFLEAVASYRAYQLTHDDRELSNFKDKIKNAEKNLEKLLETTRTETNRKIIKSIQENIKKWTDIQLGRRLELIKKDKSSGLTEAERRELLELTDQSRRFIADLKRDLEQIVKNIHDNSEKFLLNAAIKVILSLTISGLIIIVCVVIAFTNIFTGIKTVQEVLNNMSQGKFDTSIKTELTNEVGKMLNLLISTQEAIKVLFDKMITARKKTETNIGLVKDTSDTLNQTADTGKILAKQIEDAVEQTASSISYVASAMEQMVATITEISKNTMNAKQAADHASAESENAMAVVESLNQSAQRVSEVSKLIGNIASQTNLLALNATIEAARAGEAGKGFAVVANEVKELAKQTAQSVQEIEAIIQEIQRGTQDTLNVMRSINEAISRVADINNQIASAVEEQTATANEISKRLQESNQKANDVANSSNEITSLSEKLAERAAYLTKVTRDLSDANEELREAMSVFKTLQ